MGNVKGHYNVFISKFCFLNTSKTKKAVIFIRSRSQRSARLVSNYVLGGFAHGLFSQIVIKK